MTTGTKARDNTEEEALMAIESEERRRERARLLDEAIAAGALPGRDEMARYTFEQANPLHQDYDVAMQAQEWTPKSKRNVWICGPPNAQQERLGYALLNVALDDLYSVAAIDARRVMSDWVTGAQLGAAARADVLLLENGDVTGWTWTEIARLYRLMAERADHERTTIVTATRSPKDVIAYYEGVKEEAIMSARLNLLNTYAGGTLVLQLQGGAANG